MVSVRKLMKGAAAATLLVASATVGAAPAGSAGAAGATGATPAARTATPAVLEVTPSTGLVDNQTVTITTPAGSATTDENSVEYALCPAASTDLVDCSYLGMPDTGQGTFTTRIPALVLTGDGISTVTATDCRTTACVVRAIAYDYDSDMGSVVVAEAPVSFDPVAALRTPPSLAASPSTGLVDGQSVNVTLTAADSAGSGSIVVECARPITTFADLGRVYSECDLYGSAGFVASSGDPSTQAMQVSTYISTVDGPVDCRAAGAQCALVALDAIGQTDNVVLDFDPDASVDPAILQRPGASPVDPMVVDIVGFTPGDPFTVRWCNDAGACLPGVIASGTLDANGVGSFTYSDTTFPDLPDGDTTCSDMCYLTVSDAHGVSVRGPFGIGIGPPIPNEPFTSVRHPVTVTPHKGLRDGDTVTVTASGFRPGTEIAIVECTGKALTEGASACDIDTSTLVNGRSITADGNGKVAATYEIERFLQTDEGSVDCAKGNVDPDAYAQGIAADPSRFTTLEGGGYFSCIVAVADLANYSESGGAPIAFEGAQFKKLPWEHDAPRPASTAPAATPVKAQPAFTG